jgi:hypothetical protein
MLQDLEAADEIGEQADRLLRAAGAYGRFPTPVDDLVGASRLTEAADYVLDESLVSRAPAYLRALLRSARHKIQGLLDRRARVIHISPDIEHEGKRRFVKLHETTHHILPHQRDLLYAEYHETLSPATRRLFEREANQGAAELLFQRQQFAKDAADLHVSVDAIWQLAARYGSSFHAAIRRYAETHSGAVAAVVLEPTPSSECPPRWRREEAIASPGWTSRFGRPAWPRLLDARAYPFVAALDFPELPGVEMRDLSGAMVAVCVDVCTTPYHSFLLLWVPSRRQLLRLGQPRGGRSPRAGLRPVCRELPHRTSRQAACLLDPRSASSPTRRHAERSEADPPRRSPSGRTVAARTPGSRCPSRELR